MTRKDKIKSMLDELGDVQEKFLALPDEMKDSLNARDNQSLESFYVYMTEYNNSLDGFIKQADELASRVKKFFSIDPEIEDIESSKGELGEINRIIEELDKTVSHSLNEDFTFKRPYGFILNGHAVKGLKTWRSLLFHVLKRLHELNPEKYPSILEVEVFVSAQENPYFSTTPNDFRRPMEISGNLYAEVHRSAKEFIMVVKKLLIYFSYNVDDMKIYLREDRNASG